MSEQEFVLQTLLEAEFLDSLGVRDALETVESRLVGEFPHADLLSALVAAVRKDAVSASPVAGLRQAGPSRFLSLLVLAVGADFAASKDRSTTVALIGELVGLSVQFQVRAGSSGSPTSRTSLGVGVLGADMTLVRIFGLLNELDSPTARRLAGSIAQDFERRLEVAIASRRVDTRSVARLRAPAWLAGLAHQLVFSALQSSEERPDHRRKVAGRAARLANAVALLHEASLVGAASRGSPQPSAPCSRANIDALLDAAEQALRRASRVGESDAAGTPCVRLDRLIQRTASVLEVLSRRRSEDVEQLVLVNDEDNELGTASREACHRGAGLRHRAFVVLLENGRGEVLLQRRAGHKLGGGRWDVSATSHVRSGETYASAIRRALNFELGIASPLPLRRLLTYVYTESFGESSENEFCVLFAARLTEPLLPNAAELDALRWLGPRDLLAEVRGCPDGFTRWLREALERLEGSRDGIATLLGAPRDIDMPAEDAR